MNLKSVTLAASMLLSPLAHADVADVLIGSLVDYTVIGSKVIDKYYDPGLKEETSFNGCKPGRVIVFTDRSTLTCTGDKFQYASKPKVAILVSTNAYRGHSSYAYKMVVKDTVHDMRR
jgi:hypothetical protein